MIGKKFKIGSVLFVIFALFVSCGNVPIVTVGLCGNDAGVDATLDAAPDAPPIDALPTCHGIAIAGQSNARGTGSVAELTSGLTYLAQPFPEVQEAVRIAKGTAYPPNPPWIYYPLSDTQPHTTWTSTLRFGIELTLARDLYAARPADRWVVFKATFDDTSLASSWNPVGPLFNDTHNWFAEQATMANCPISAYIWIQGETDAMISANATAYGSNLSAYVTAVRDRFGPVPFIYGRLHVGTAAPYVSVVRDGQNLLNMPNTYLLDQDSFALRTNDHIHFTTTALTQLGSAYAPVVMLAVP